MADLWWLGMGIALFIAVLAGLFAARRSRPPFRTVTVRARVTATLVSASMLAAAVFCVLAGARQVQADNLQADRLQAEFAKYVAPLAEELTRVGFEPVAGTSFTDRSAYQFTADSTSDGTVTVLNKDNQPIRIQFEIGESYARVGCFDGKFLPVGPYGAQLLRATSRGCP